ncbi:MAG: GtrA family protein [Clostridiales Family XIII bacterium]|jgi:putative flippase GtrA|nr:GtrA family protein [Clostridiales Family XIII bacterium]
MIVDHKKFIKFTFSGGLAALVNLVSRWVLYHFLNYAVSVTIAYLLGMLTAFITFKYFVFNSGKSGKTRNEIIWFIVVNIMALAQTLVISVFLAEYLFPRINFEFYPYDIAHIIGVAVPIISSYLLHKELTFKMDDNTKLS